MVVPDRVGQVQVFPAVWLNKSHRRLSKGASHKQLRETAGD